MRDLFCTHSGMPTYRGINMDISIIIPAYNVEKTIIRTIDLLKNQTYQDFEIICVNDSSDDRTIEILDDIRKKDNRIFVFSNEKRMGAAYSRNLGLKYSKGKYVIFLDGDDYFYPDMLKDAITLAEENDLDFSVFDYEIKDCDDGTIIHRSLLSSTKYSEIIFSYGDIATEDYRKLVIAPWNKLIRRDFLQNNNIYFQSISNSNDFKFSMLCYLLAKRIQCVKTETPLICQYKHNGNERISNNRVCLNEFIVFKALLEEANYRKFDEKQIDLIFIKCVDSIIRQFRDGEGDGTYYTFLKDEGINELRTIGGDKFLKISSYYNNPLDKFIQKEYETKWFEKYHSSWLSIIDSRNEIWDYWNENKTIAVWGAGYFGKIYLSIINERNKTAKYWFDSNNENELIIDGQIYKAEKPTEEKIKECDVIIVAINNAPSEIYDQIKAVDNGIIVEILKFY